MPSRAARPHRQLRGTLANGAGRWDGALGSLRERPFRLLWLAATSSAVGDALIPVALAFAVLEDLNGSPTDLGFVLAAFSVSLVGFTLAGGVWADRVQRRLLSPLRRRVRVGHH
jgi:MFS family permease